MGDTMALTAKEMRHNAVQRVKKFNAKMKAEGYKRINVFVSDEFREVLKDLKSNQGMAQHEAMEHILKIYLDNVNHNDQIIYNNVNNNIEKDNDIIGLKNKIENQDKIIDELMRKLDYLFESKPQKIVEQELLFEDEQEEQIQEPLPELKTDDPKEEKKKRKEEYTKLILDMRDKGLKAKDIKTKLEKMGVKTSGNKSKWSLSTIYNILKNN